MSTTPDIATSRKPTRRQIEATIETNQANAARREADGFTASAAYNHLIIERCQARLAEGDHR